MSSYDRAPAEYIDSQQRLFINGQWVDSRSRETFQCLDPFVEQAWGRVSTADADDVDRAVDAARQAFTAGEWANALPAARAALLRRFGALISEHGEELVRLQICENGKLISEMRPGVGVMAGHANFYAGLAELLHGHAPVPSVPNFVGYTARDPIGVVAAIVPWNTPLALLCWKLFPALAAGNTMVIKPSEVTPISAIRFVQLLEQAGLPPGVVNLVTGAGATGEALVAHPLVDKIAFTGSTATGLKIAETAARRAARVTLELGGKSPNIIFADADLSAATNGVMAGIFAATGQSCMGGSRVLVQREVYEQVADLLVERGGRMIAGDPLDPATQLGPLASRAQLDKVSGYFRIAREEGLECLLGGRAMDRTGFFVEPTIYGNVPPDSRIAREEVFGPVIALMPFDDESEALAIGNDTRYGLAAGVWTRDVKRAHRMAKSLRAGTVWVNNYRILNHTMPFGGFGLSGIGREMGIDALNDYTEVKSVWIDTGNDVEFPTG